MFAIASSLERVTMKLSLDFGRFSAVAVLAAVDASRGSILSNDEVRCSSFASVREC